MKRRKRSKILNQVKTAPTRGFKVCRMLRARSHWRPQSRIFDALLREFSQIDRFDQHSQNGAEGIAWMSKQTLANAAGICVRSSQNWAVGYKDDVMRDDVGERWKIKHSFDRPTEYIIDRAPRGDKSIWASREILSMPGLSAAAKVVHAEMLYYRNKLDREACKRYEAVHGKGSGKRKMFVGWFSEEAFSRRQRHLAQELEKRRLLEIYREPGKPNLYRLLDWHDPIVQEKAPAPRCEILFHAWYGWGVGNLRAMELAHRSLKIGFDDKIGDFYAGYT